MRFAPSSSGSRFRSCFGTRSQLLGLGAVSLLAFGISACASSSGTPNPVVDAGPGEGKSDAASDVRSDVRTDVARDVPPAPVDVPNPLCSGVSPTTDFSDPYVIADFEMGND